jgi:hypothetical protein
MDTLYAKGCAGPGAKLSQGPYDVITVKQENYDKLHFDAYYLALTQLGFIFSVEQPAPDVI